MAADLLGAMRVEIIGDNSKLDKSIDNSEKKANSFSKTLKTLFAGIVVTAAVKEIAKIGKELIDSASDAEETKNKFNVVFASVADDAKAASDRIRDEFKLSESTTENFLSGVGDITSGLGATSEQALLAAEQITTLGLDIDSFANLSGGAEQAVKALTSLFTGEREAAKALGIVINDTNLKQFAEDSGLVFKELSPLEKGFLSLELATSQSQLAIGDFSRSIDSFANRQKIAKEAVEDLKVEIGKRLLPVATESIELFGELTGALAEFIKERNRLRDAELAADLGTESIDQRILLLREENKELQLRFDRIKSGSEANQTLAEIDRKVVEEQLAGIKQQIEGNNAIIGVVERGIELRKQEAAAIKAGETAAAEEAAAEAERLERLADLIQARKDAISQLNENIQAIETAAKAEVITEEEKIAAIIDAETDFQKELLQLGFDGVENSRGLLDIGDQNLIDSVERRKELLEGFEEERLTATQIAADEKLSAALSEEEAIKERDTRIAEFRIEKDKETNDKLVEQRQAAIESITSILSTFDSIGDAFADAELQRLEESGASQEELDKKKAQFAKENAIRERAAALFQIGVDTPAAIVKALTAGPILGPILAVAIGALAGAQAIALLATPLPKFAQGGIVAGNSFVGDSVPAMVNSGEMILNRQQQAQLFSMANGSTTNNNTTNTNTINNNAMFALGNRAQLDQAAKILFEPLERERQRRGAV